MKRRQCLRYLGGVCLASAATVSAQQAPGLAEIARQSGRQFGFAIHPSHADKVPVAGLLRQHAGVIVAENAMKWRHIETVFGGRDYTDADQVLALAERLKADVRGHTLAWHQSTPAHLTWVSSAQFVQAQTSHLQALVSRYRGRIHTWDVLNEAIDPSANARDGMRESVLSKLWGVDRYPALFELARQTDPGAKLAYNDYGMEQDEPWCDQRRHAALHLLEDWVTRKVPLDVVGLQAHLDLARRFSAKKLSTFFDQIQAMGLTIQITELDVRDRTTPGDRLARDAAVAALYKDFIDVCTSHAAVEMVVLWNVTDADSWVNRWGQGPGRIDGQPMRPTLFDEQGQAKPAFEAVANSLRQAKVKFNKKAGNHV